MSSAFGMLIDFSVKIFETILWLQKCILYILASENLEFSIGPTTGLMTID